MAPRRRRHVRVSPADSARVTSLAADFEVLTALRPTGCVNGLEAPRTATESLAILEWNQVVLYPADNNTDELRYQAQVRLPAGWKYATALRAQQTLPESVRFEPTSLTTLVDSTLIAGRYFESFELGGEPAVRLHVAADGPAALHLTPTVLEHYRRLVGEAQALFGATHYRHYDFLYVLTDQIMPDGLEHHESSDNRSPYRTFLDDDVRRAEANLLAHEYAHSWNGKYRRPVGLATRNYQDPMRGELLWVYEGLTEYLGDVLAVRSGLLTTEEFQSEFGAQSGRHAKPQRAPLAQSSGHGACGPAPVRATARLGCAAAPPGGLLPRIGAVVAGGGQPDTPTLQWPPQPR